MIEEISNIINGALSLLRFLLYSSIISIMIVFLFLVSSFVAGMLFNIRFKRYFLILTTLSCFVVGYFAFVLGILSSLSRTSGNASIISAAIPAFGAIFLYLKEKSIELAIVLTIASVVFVANIYSGVYLGSLFRVKATESLDALKHQVIKEKRLYNLRENFDLPTTSVPDKTSDK